MRIDLIGDVPFSVVDTTDVTAGEVPLRTYISKETLQLNDTPCVEESMTKQLGEESIGTIDQTLLLQKNYGDITFSSVPSEVVTRVGVAVPENRVSYISYETYEN